KKLYVGNLSWGVNDAQLQELFAPYGTVVSAQVIMDRDTGRSKGFGFVEMGTDQEAQAAITGMHGQVIEGRPLTVNEARPKEGGGGGGGRGGGGGGYGGGRGGGGGPREMFSAICGECGKPTQVPFKPRGDRPVYCSDCFAKRR